MPTDLHHNDDEYRKAYHRLEEEPSAQVWDKVSAALDGRDAKYYQQKSLRWKRTSLLLLLLLGTVVISGILYVSGRKLEGQQTSTNSNDKKRETDQSFSHQPLFNDNNATTQNINKKDIYAAAKRPQSDSVTISSALHPTAPKQLDERPEQDDAGIRKQAPEQVQDTSVNNSSSAMRQQAVLKDNAPFRNKKQQPAPAKNLAPLSDKASQQTLVKKNNAFTGNDGLHIYAQNEPSGKRNTAFPVTILKKKSTTIRNKRNKDLYEPGDERYESITSILLPASGLKNAVNSIGNKEIIDTNVIAQINAIAEPTLQKHTMPDVATTTIVEKAINIAKPFKPRLQLTGYSSLDFTQYHLDNDEHGNNNNSPRHREDKHDFKERENPGLSFSVGLMARLEVTRKASLKTGLSYSNTTINIQPQTLYADKDDNQRIAYKFTTSSGYAYVKTSGSTLLTIGDSTTAAYSHQQLQYLSVPVMFGYTAFTGKRFTIIPSFGAAANFLLSTKIKTAINSASTKEPVVITKLDGIQSWYPSLIADAEIQYHIKRNWSITLLPSLRYAIRPITQNNPVKTVPYSFGLGLGFTRHL